MTASSGTWLEIACCVEAEAVEAVSEAFARWGQGVAVEQPVESSRDGDVVTVPDGADLLVKTYLPSADPDTSERRRHIEQAVWALGRLRRVSPASVREVREEDWANAWKEHFFVHRVGERTVIVPSWRAHEHQPRPDDVVLLLDPGMAFGTGLHPTTRLCLRALEQIDLHGKSVLDLGAGSGILAIAAAKMGAAHVDAVEVEHVSAIVCRENVERNRVASNVAVTHGTLGKLQDQRGANHRFDVAVANITIRVLLDLHPALAAVLKPGAVAILSGVLDERADELIAVLEEHGWRHQRTDREQDWVAVVVHAPSGA